MNVRIQLFVIALVAIVGALSPVVAAIEINVTNSANTDAVLFGVSDLRKAAAKIGQTSLRVMISVGNVTETAGILAASRARIPEKPESFVIARSGGNIAIAGRDVVGAMYGCLELAERIEMDGKRALALKDPVAKSPFAGFRAVNRFLGLPYGKEHFDSWWFTSEDFWQGYLDQLARSRINWVDLHAMYTVDATSFPNMYAYFITSEKFPEAGVRPEIAAKNLAMLDKITKMAKARGVNVAIMNYSVEFGPHCRENSYDWKDGNTIADYIYECVHKLLKACPNLGMIGFRVGESGKAEQFYSNVYLAATREAGRPIQIYTRAWGLSKSGVLKLSKHCENPPYVEIKFIGEQYPQPYVIAGGRTCKEWNKEQWFYQGFLSEPIGDYKLLWQVRLNGTLRVFPWGVPDFVARTARMCQLRGVAGLTVEQIDGVYPASDFLHPENSDCAWYRWMYERDWFFYNVWGRMSYDPKLPQRVWIQKFKARFGEKVGAPLYKAMVVSGRVLPYACSFYAPGERSMDQRSYAPGLMVAGDIGRWTDELPMDLQNLQTPTEFARRVVDNNPSARLSTLQMADIMADLGADIERNLEQAEKSGGSGQEFVCLSRDLRALSQISLYYAERLRSVANFAVFRLTNDRVFAEDARMHHEKAVKHWSKLAEITDSHYKPFVETIAMHTQSYTWAAEGKKLDGALRPLDEAMEAAATPMGIGREALYPRGDGKGPRIDVKRVDVGKPKDGKKTVRVFARVTDPAGVKSVVLKYRPLPTGEQDWQLLEMKERRDGLWTGTAVAHQEGMMWAIEALDADGNGTLWPDFRTDIPYRIVYSWK